MESGYNDMDKKLRQLENQSLPDLSKMDEHWEQFAKANAPFQPSVPKRIKPVWWIVAVVTLIAIIYGLRHQGKESDQSLSKQANTNINRDNDTVPARIKYDSLVTVSSVKDSIGRLNVETSKRESVLHIFPSATKEKDSIAYLDVVTTEGKKMKLEVRIPKSKPSSDNKIHFIPPPPPPPAPKVELFKQEKDTSISRLQPVTTEDRLLLFDFFKQLEKPFQQFSIDPLRDTILFSKDGGAVHIPARSFAATRIIRIEFREFYSYQDMVCHRLNTSSNGKQLETGGMINIFAFDGDKEIKLAAGKSIRWLIPGPFSELRDMQLFTADRNIASYMTRELSLDKDSIDSSKFPLEREINANAQELADINWLPNNQFFGNREFISRVRVVDLRNRPFKTRLRRGRAIGYFLRSKSSAISTSDLKSILESKYQYDRVVVRTRHAGRIRSKISPTGPQTPLGDTTYIPLSEAIKDSLPILSAVSTNSQGGQRPQSLGFIQQAVSVRDRFGVDIFTLGWINCDRFFNVPGPKTDLIVDLGYNASGFASFIVFDRIRSMLSGQTRGTKVAFRNIPAGETVRVISVGSHNGKIFAAMKTVTISETNQVSLNFEVTGKDEFQQLANISTP